MRTLSEGRCRSWRHWPGTARAGGGAPRRQQRRKPISAHLTLPTGGPSHFLPRCFKPRPTASIMRSSQLDAERLDEELTSLLREQLQRCFALFRPGLISRLQPEITLLLDFLVSRAADKTYGV